jgi:hypothetical protein
LKINFYADEVMSRVMEELGLEIPLYTGFHPEDNPELCSSVLKTEDTEQENSGNEAEDDTSKIKSEGKKPVKPEHDEQYQSNGKISLVTESTQRLKSIKTDNQKHTAKHCLDIAKTDTEEPCTDEGCSDSKKPKLDIHV